jgi:transcriptional regulator with XRE-family HTH domain
MTFAALLREKRLAKGYTQERLAQRCGVSHAAVQAWERGGTAPGIGCLQLLSIALGVPLNELLACKFPADQRMKPMV